MRVVFLTHNYPRFDGDVSGSFLATLAQALVRRGHDLTVIAPSDEGQGGDEIVGGVRIRRVRYARADRETIAYRGTMAQAAGSVSGLLALAGLRRALKEAAREELAAGADLVHAHWWVPGGLACPEPAPMVLTVHGTDGMLLARSFLARRLARAVFRRARVVTTVSHYLARVIQEATGREVSPAWIQPMPAATEHFHPAPAPAPTRESLIVVSRLTVQKRVDLAIRAAGALRHRGTPLPLTVVGDGPERARLEKLTLSLRLEGLVEFVGTQSAAGVAEYLGRATIMLFPAREEGFGLVAAEALMAGVPVVACRDGGGLCDIVPESGPGRLVAATPAIMADAVVHLMRTPQRAAQAATLGEAWRRRLAPDAVATRCEAWYAEALNA